MSFYERTIRTLIRNGWLTECDSVLIVCGGPLDARTMNDVGLKNVVITNLDERYDGYCAPFDWAHADAENLTYANESFDWVIQHAGLHHCISPHRGLLEMVRVARKGILAIEARDSALIRFAVRMGFTSEYEIESVALDPNMQGGQRNTGIPNFVYRWTEREVYKTVEAAYPDKQTQLCFFYGLSLPTKRLRMSGGIKRAAGQVLGAIMTLISTLAPRQSNQFGFVVRKEGSDKPWIFRDQAGARLDPNFRLGFDPSKYPLQEVGVKSQEFNAVLPERDT